MPVTRIHSWFRQDIESANNRSPNTVEVRKIQRPAAPTEPLAAAVAEEAAFRREGQCWTIVYRGTVVRLRDAKGLRYLASLLARPGESVAAHELLATVRTERAQPRSAADPAAGSGDAERARLAVTKRIKSAIHTIESHCPDLGYHLTVTIRTGAKCVYRADPQRPVRWAI